MSNKAHFPLLDGLRGVAAILVVVYHLFEAYFPVPVHPENHGYLAVDFFFMLSGFVVGYAYDDRWSTMTMGQFFKIRMIRLHPMVILSVIIGVIAYWFDPFLPAESKFGLGKLLLTMVLAFTLLPHPDVRGWNETHSIDGPLWSLFQEYIANFLYAIGFRRFSQKALAILCVFSGLALATVAIQRGDLGTGWGFDTFWIGLTRMLFPFFAGLFLFRSNWKISIPYSGLASVALLIAVFFTPRFSNLQVNGGFEAIAIIFIFPVIILLGAAANVSELGKKLCNLGGGISYPVYIIHYPIIYIYTMWIALKKPTPSEIVPIAIGLFFLFFIAAYAALKLYDEPIRRKLKTKN